VLEIEGLPKLRVEQAFEISDASAERSAAGCTIKLDKEPIIEYLTSNVTMLRWMIKEGYGDARTLEHRAQAMEAWLANPQLMEADKDAEYAAIIEINLNEIKEPLLACPNDPDDVKKLSDVQNTKIDEVFIGSCMTNIGHYRAAGKLLSSVKDGSLPTTLWIAPPTRMDEYQLKEEGYYGIFGASGARTEMPGCSLCMGNQARVKPGATVVSTSTRNFPNRLGDNTNVFLASAELAAVAAVVGKLPTPAEYLEYAGKLNTMGAEIYRYLNFNEIESFQQAADKVKTIHVTQVQEVVV
jgi:aconitate hydratase 2/2-methylisocitrate dehydratase